MRYTVVNRFWFKKAHLQNRSCTFNVITQLPNNKTLLAKAFICFPKKCHHLLLISNIWGNQWDNIWNNMDDSKLLINRMTSDMYWCVGRANFHEEIETDSTSHIAEWIQKSFKTRQQLKLSIKVQHYEPCFTCQEWMK